MPGRRISKRNVDEIHESNLAHIKSRSVRTAYLYLIRVAEKLSDFDCYPALKGVVRDFRYFSDDDQPFAFIVNQDSILFYLRKPAITRFKPKLPRLKDLFSEVNLPRDYEITIRIRDLQDAKLLMEEIFDFVDA
jgi:hypothetical protein